MSPASVMSALTDATARRVLMTPVGLTSCMDRFDARPGGGYRLVLASGDSATAVLGSEGTTEVAVDARFVTVEPDRVVEDVDVVSSNPDWASTMSFNWTVEGHDEGAVVRVTASDSRPAVSADDREVDLASMLLDAVTALLIPGRVTQLGGRYWDDVEAPAAAERHAQTLVYVDNFRVDTIGLRCELGDTVSFPVSAHFGQVDGRVIAALPTPIDWVGIEEPDWPSDVADLWLARGTVHAITQVSGGTDGSPTPLTLTPGDAIYWASGDQDLGWVVTLQPATTWPVPWTEALWRDFVDWSERE